MIKTLTLFTLLVSITSAVSGLNRTNFMTDQQKFEIATIGGGCFWCTEAVFEKLKGVISVESGYSGGFIKNPSYNEVCRGTTGHAEVIQVRFNPLIISYKQVLEIFFSTHDPTTLNQQGADVGTQYRSVIFYHNATQERIARQVIIELPESSGLKKPIVTEVSPLTAFFMAEDYHQDYFEKNPDASYCAFVIRPKIDKFRKNYSEKLK